MTGGGATKINKTIKQLGIPCHYVHISTGLNGDWVISPLPLAQSEGGVKSGGDNPPPPCSSTYVLNQETKLLHKKLFHTGNCFAHAHVQRSKF